MLKITEKKTLKGNSYAIIKLTDLGNIFELFIFSDTLELNRKSLVEGNSLLIRVVKNLTEEENRFKRINVKKISILKDLFNNPINEVEFNLRNLDKLNEISQNLKKEGKIDIKFKINNKENELIFKLKNKRHIDRKSINLLKNKDISTIIH